MKIKSPNLITRLYYKSLFPNILAVLGGTVNVLADGILVGQKLGSVGISVINQSLAIYLLLCTIGSLISSGCAINSSLMLGKNDRDKSIEYYHIAFTLSIISSVIFTIIGLVLLSPVCKMLSTTETYEGLYTYLRITLIGGFSKIMLYIVLFYLRIEGKNTRAAVSMLTMMLLNIILDALFLFVFDWGIAGAAFASVLATIIACVLGFTFLQSKDSIFKIRFKLPSKKQLLSCVYCGAPMAFNNVLSAIRLILLNIIMNNIAPIGCTVIFALLNSLNEFLICIQNGIPQTAGAMTSIFQGEKDNRGIRDIFNTQLNSGVLISTLVGISVIALYRVIPVIYGTNEYNLFAFACFSISFMLGTVNSILFYYYTSTNHTIIAGLIVFARILLFSVIFAFILAPYQYIWLFFPLGELATLIMTYIIVTSLGKRKGLAGMQLLDPNIDNDGKSITMEVECNDIAICNASQSINEFCSNNDLPPKKQMALSLAIEEILGIINDKSLGGHGTMDVRLLYLGDETILRIRSGGKRYNPFDRVNSEENLDYLGVSMIAKISSKIDYQSSMGLNTLIIHI